MARMVQITRNAQNGDVLDVLEHLKPRYGSCSNAAVQCIRGSDIAKAARQDMAAEAEKAKRDKVIQQPPPAAALAQGDPA